MLVGVVPTSTFPPSQPQEEVAVAASAAEEEEAGESRAQGSSAFLDDNYYYNNDKDSATTPPRAVEGKSDKDKKKRGVSFLSANFLLPQAPLTVLAHKKKSRSRDSMSSRQKSSSGSAPSSRGSAATAASSKVSSSPVPSRLTVPSGDGSSTAGAASLSSSSSSSFGSGAAPPPLYNYSSSGASGAFHSSMTLSQYLTRMVDFNQMDVQSALDQMRTLCTWNPQRVYKTSYYRKQTKNHWARDDPAFCTLQVMFLVLASIAYCIAFRSASMIRSTVVFSVQSVVVHWLGAGVVLATTGRALANHHLTVHQSNTHVRQRVEWLYAFDIHCNAFFPLFVMIYVVQFFLLPLVLGKSLLALIVSNTLYAVAFSWYFYISHLGYRALPFLSNTEVFLFPIAAVVLLYVLNLVGYPFGLGWNASRVMAHVYFY